MVPRRSMVTPWPARTKEQSRCSSNVANNCVSGTLRACASDCSVASEGEIWPFSIFDSIPAEIPAATARSETVSSPRRRNKRICAPSACSSVRSAVPAPDPVVSSSDRDECGARRDAGREADMSVASVRDAVLRERRRPGWHAPRPAFAAAPVTVTALTRQAWWGAEKRPTRAAGANRDRFVRQNGAPMSPRHARSKRPLKTGSQFPTWRRSAPNACSRRED